MSPDAPRPRMHPFHIAIVAVGLPLLLAAGIALVLVEHGWNGEFRQWLPLTRTVFGIIAIGLPAITAVGSVHIARRAAKLRGASPIDHLPAEIRAQVEHMRRNPPPPPAPLTPGEREHLRSTDLEALTEEQRNRYILAPTTGLTKREKRKLLGVLSSGETYRDIGDLMRQQRVPPGSPQPLTVALRPVGLFGVALMFTLLPVSIFVVDALIVVTAFRDSGARDVAPGWGVLLAAPVLGWFLTLLGPAVLGMALNTWTCFVRSLRPRFRTSRIAIIDRRSITPIHRTKVTAVWRFIELTAWWPPWPLLLAAVLNGVGVLAVFNGWVLPAGLLWAAAIVLAVFGVRRRWLQWRPRYDALPTA